MRAQDRGIELTAPEATAQTSPHPGGWIAILPARLSVTAPPAVKGRDVQATSARTAAAAAATPGAIVEGALVVECEVAADVAAVVVAGVSQRIGGCSKLPPAYVAGSSELKKS
jgi:hypothetical protein